MGIAVEQWEAVERASRIVAESRYVIAMVGQA